ncbi:glycoside hydrolase family 16 protein [Haliangium ochraceum]|uniref:Glycoside hydrolase family 16 n=1 Tax=Haliangium ochraceum (strain DSM 14365 / JCM 11303 / SMP-2) TaxID=502025 RepID=D0LSA6_HALO1|nr:glycoside hydrolase family 16 protein [Haliangium ochraceum]ACY15605.1 glycoside hydrolase family 16 [Haliangium ochraceum DSM 14365]
MKRPFHVLAVATCALIPLSLSLLSAPTSAAPPCGGPNSDPCPEPDPDPTPEPPGFDGSFDELVWADEFDGPGIDPANWSYDLGGSGWGNNEYQFYTDSANNSRIENGMLVIEAREERIRSRNYTSARLKSEGLQEFTYGRIEARIRVPFGQGIWPAFWSLGNNFGDVGWPGSGEIDIMEHIGREPFHVYGTVHGPGYSGENGVGDGIALANPVTDDFHVFAVEWEPDEIRWYVDGVHYHTVTPQTVPGEWVYDHGFFLILNVAVGGYWPGYPDETTQFPQRMLVDYVRVYQ